MTTPITHQPAMQQRLLQQQQGRPNWNALVFAIGGQVENLENAFIAVESGRLLPNAQGAQLDGIGTLVGIDRNGLSDQAYRLELQAKIAANDGQATLPDILSIVLGMFNASSASVTSPAPATVAISVADPKTPQALYPQALQLIGQSLAAGVRLASVQSYASQTNFRLAGGDGLGFGDVADPSSGGTLAGRIF